MFIDVILTLAYYLIMIMYSCLKYTYFYLRLGLDTKVEFPMFVLFYFKCLVVQILAQMGWYLALIELGEAEASFLGLSWDVFGLDGELYFLQVGGLSLAGFDL